MYLPVISHTAVCRNSVYIWPFIKNQNENWKSKMAAAAILDFEKIDVIFVRMKWICSKFDSIYMIIKDDNNLSKSAIFTHVRWRRPPSWIFKSDCNLPMQSADIHIDTYGNFKMTTPYHNYYWHLHWVSLSSSRFGTGTFTNATVAEFQVFYFYVYIFSFFLFFFFVFLYFCILCFFITLHSKQQQRQGTLSQSI